MTKARFLYVTDLHGSEAVWRKFLNSARYFDLDALVLSGDMTGKFMIPIIKRSDGKYDATIFKKKYVISQKELPEFKKKSQNDELHSTHNHSRGS